MRYYQRSHIIILKFIQETFQWLSDNQMKGNTKKCHLIMSTDQSTNFPLAAHLYKEWIVRKG